MSGDISIPYLGPITPGGVGIWTLIGTFIVAWFRFKPLMAKLKNERETSASEVLLKRVTALEEQQIKYRAEVADQRERDREACIRETDELRGQIREQSKMIDGLQRQLIMYQVATGRVLPQGTLSAEMESMLASLGPLYHAPGRVSTAPEPCTIDEPAIKPGEAKDSE